MMRCNCENSLCGLHEPAGCQDVAFVKCDYIGGVCIDCAIGLKDYLIPLGMDRRPNWEDWAIFKSRLPTRLSTKEAIM